MAVEDRISDHPVEAARTLEDIQRIALLRADGDGIDNGRIGVIRFQPPLVAMQMEHMRFLDPAVYQADL